MPSSSCRVRGTPAVSQRVPTWSRKLSAISCRPFSISLSWILRCFLISSGVLNCAGRPVSSWRKRTSCSRAAYTWLAVILPPPSRASSIARSTAQSECCELSTGTKISVYMTPRAMVAPVCWGAVAKSMWLGPADVKQAPPASGLRPRRDLRSRLVPGCERVDGTGVAGAKQRLAGHGLGSREHDYAFAVECERLRRRLDAVAKADAQPAVDADAQPRHRALLRLVRRH